MLISKIIRLRMPKVKKSTKDLPTGEAPCGDYRVFYIFVRCFSFVCKSENVKTLYNHTDIWRPMHQTNKTEHCHFFLQFNDLFSFQTCLIIILFYLNY